MRIAYHLGMAIIETTKGAFDHISLSDQFSLAFFVTVLAKTWGKQPAEFYQFLTQVGVL